MLCTECGCEGVFTKPSRPFSIWTALTKGLRLLFLVAFAQKLLAHEADSIIVDMSEVGEFKQNRSRLRPEAANTTSPSVPSRPLLVASRSSP